METLLVLIFFLFLWLFGQPGNVVIDETIRRVSLLVGGWILVIAPVFSPVYFDQISGFLWPYKMGAGSAAAFGVGLLLLRYKSGRSWSTYFLILISVIIMGLVVWNYVPYHLSFRTGD